MPSGARGSPGRPQALRGANPPGRPGCLQGAAGASRTPPGPSETRGLPGAAPRPPGWHRAPPSRPETPRDTRTLGAEVLQGTRLPEHREPRELRRPHRGSPAARPSRALRFPRPVPGPPCAPGPRKRSPSATGSRTIQRLAPPPEARSPSRSSSHPPDPRIRRSPKSDPPPLGARWDAAHPGPGPSSLSQPAPRRPASATDRDHRAHNSPPQPPRRHARLLPLRGRHRPPDSRQRPPSRHRTRRVERESPPPLPLTVKAGNARLIVLRRAVYNRAGPPHAAEAPHPDLPVHDDNAQQQQSLTSAAHCRSARGPYHPAPATPTGSSPHPLHPARTPTTTSHGGNSRLPLPQ